jgi:hypothetical protein
MIQQLHSIPEVNTRLSDAITKAIQEIQTNSRARRKANMNSIRAASRAKNWTNAIKRTAETRDAAKILFDKGNIKKNYLNDAIALAKTASNAKAATKTDINLDAFYLLNYLRYTKQYEDAEKEYEDAKKEYDTININNSDIDSAKKKMEKANLVYDKATKYAKAATAYTSIVENTHVSDEAKYAVLTAEAERRKITTAYLKLFGKKGGRNKTNRKYKKSQYRKFKTQYRKRSLRIR